MEEKVLDEKYTNFIDSIINQMTSLMPEDVNELQKNYLVSNIKKSTTITANSIVDDEDFSRLNFEDQCFYIQVMGEWSFHKEIDLFRSGIPAKYWKVIMQKIWFTMWEVMYACVQNEAPKEVVLSLVERFVNRTYRDAIEELKEEEVIDEQIEEKAKEQSNIEIMAQELRRERKINEKFKGLIKLIFLFLLVGTLVTFLILKFKIIGIIIIMTFLTIYHIYPNKKDNDE